MVKSDIRKAYIQKRLELTDVQVHEMNDLILDNFSKLYLQGVNVLLSYYPIPERREFNVALCEQLMLLDNPQICIAWPRMESDGMNMEAIAVDKQTILVKNRYNIFEPSGDKVLNPQLVDAVFVPLLAFDTKGYRVGYGKGFYDRYLSRCAQDVVKIGFSYFDALDAIDDINEFDVPLNHCITPTRVYEF